jgi:hypothetical protein
MTVKTRNVIRTSDDEIDAAIELSRRSQQPRAVAVRYDALEDAVVVRFDNGNSLHVLRANLQGLENATVDQVSDVVIEGPGTGLHWPHLDVDHYIPALLEGVFGTRRWMSDLGRKGGARTSAAKSAAARANGRRGGRPRTRHVQISYDTRDPDGAALVHGANTTVEMLRREYGADFAPGHRSDMKLKTLLERMAATSLEDYLKRWRKKR